jgi:membrane protease YdiL (CAAX protease family)
VATNSKSWELNFATAAVVWASVIVIVGILGFHLGYRGPLFGIALGVAAALFGFEFFLAVPRVLEWARRMLGGHGTVLAPLVPLLAVLIYTLTVTFHWKMALAGATYCVLPALLAASSKGKAPGTWEDYAAALLIWLPVEFRWMYGIFPYPKELTHSLTILLALSVGVAAFVLLRRMDCIGYAIIWRRGFGANVAIHFLIFSAIAVALGIEIGFLKLDPAISRLHSLPLVVFGITFFTAWPEEFLFRGVLQNLLSRTFQNQWTGLAIASVIFGLSHILHAPYPNWKYVILATIAGLFYGHVWMKTGSLVAGALVHALVDVSWHVLFR